MEASTVSVWPSLLLLLAVAGTWNGVAAQANTCEDRLTPMCPVAWRSSTNKLGLFCDMGNDSSVLLQCNACAPSTQSTLEGYPGLSGVFVDLSHCVRGSEITPRLTADFSAHTYCRGFLLGNGSDAEVLAAIMSLVGAGENYRAENTSCRQTNASFFGVVAEVNGPNTEEFKREQENFNSAFGSTASSCVRAVSLVNRSQPAIACTDGLETRLKIVEGFNVSVLGKVEYECNECAQDADGSTNLTIGNNTFQLGFNAMTSFRVYRHDSSAAGGPAGAVFYDGTNCRGFPVGQQTQYCPLLYWCAGCVQLMNIQQPGAPQSGAPQSGAPQSGTPQPTTPAGGGPSPVMVIDGRFVRDSRFIIDQTFCFRLNDTLTAPNGVVYGNLLLPASMAAVLMPPNGTYCQRIDFLDDRSAATYVQGLASDSADTTTPGGGPDSGAFGPVAPAALLTLATAALLSTVFAVTALR